MISTRRRSCILKLQNRRFLSISANRSPYVWILCGIGRYTTDWFNVAAWYWLYVLSLLILMFCTTYEYYDSVSVNSKHYVRIRICLSYQFTYSIVVSVIVTSSWAIIRLGVSTWIMYWPVRWGTGTNSVFCTSKRIVYHRSFTFSKDV